MAVVRAAPTDAATIERALRFANIAMFTITLQRRRLRSVEPEDERFALRWWLTGRAGGRLSHDPVDSSQDQSPSLTWIGSAMGSARISTPRGTHTWSGR